MQSRNAHNEESETVKTPSRALSRLSRASLFTSMMASVFAAGAQTPGPLDCTAARNALLDRFQGQVISPQVLDTLLAADTRWLTSTTGSAALMPATSNLEELRSNYLKCETQAGVEAIGGDPTVAATRYAEGKAHYYQARASESVRRTFTGSFLPPPTIGAALDEAAQQFAKENLGAAPQALAQSVFANLHAQAVSEKLNPSAMLTQPARIERALNETLRQVRADGNALSVDASGFLKKAVEREVRRNVREVSRRAERDVLQRLAGVNSSQDALDAAVRSVMNNQAVRGFVNNVKSVESVESFVKTAREVVEEHRRALDFSAKSFKTEAKKSLEAKGAELKGQLNTALKGMTPEAQVTHLKSVQQQLTSGALSPAKLKAAQDEVSSRLYAAEVSVKFATAEASFSALSGLLPEKSPATRYIKAAQMVSGQAKQIATLVAGGAMGPVGWVSMGSSLLSTGGNLGAMFGGGAGDDGGAQARHEAIMEALGDLKEQVEELRNLVIEQHKQTMATLNAQQVMTTFLLNHAAQELYEPLKDCAFLETFLENNKIADTPGLVVNLQNTNKASSNLNHFRKCKANLANTVPLRKVGDTAPPSVRLEYTFTAAELANVLASRNDVVTKETKAAQRLLFAAQRRHEAVDTLVKAAALHAEGTEPSLWHLQLHPAANWRVVSERLTRLPQGTSGLPTLSEFAKSLEGSELAHSQTWNQLVPSPMAPVPALTMLLASSRLADLPELTTDLPAPGAVISAGERLRSALELSSMNPLDLSAERVKGTKLLTGWASLALAIRGWAVTSRAEYLVPVASNLLAWEQSPTHLKCSSTDTLCKNLGGTLESMRPNVAAAIRLAREVPEFRSNIAAWRVRAALDAELGNERPDGTRDTANYEQLLSDPRGFRLTQTLKAPRLFHIKADPITADPAKVMAADTPRSEGGWYLPLSGKCDGVERLSTLAKNGAASCNGLTCADTAALPEEAKKDTWDTWEAGAASACIVAALPDPERVASGRPLTDQQSQMLLDVSDAFIGQTAYYLELERLSKTNGGRSIRAMEFISYVRPPLVPLWRKSAALPLPAGR